MDIILVATTTEEVEKKGYDSRGVYENLADYDNKEDFLASIKDTLELMNISGDTPAFLCPAYLLSKGFAKKLPREANIVTATDINDDYWTFWKFATDDEAMQKLEKYL